MKGLLVGTFNPPSKGHLDLIQRAAKICEHLTIAIAKNPTKSTEQFFSVQERIEMLRKICSFSSNIQITSFTGLTIEFAKQIGATFLVRGLRTTADFAYEFSMATINRQIGGVETVFFPSDERYMHISSKIIREIATFGSSLESFIPLEIAQEVLQKMRDKNSE